MDGLVLGIELCGFVALTELFGGLVVGLLFDRSSAARIPDTLRPVFTMSGGARGKLLELSEARTRGGSGMSAYAIAVNDADGISSCFCCVLSAVSRVLNRNMTRRMKEQSPGEMPDRSGVLLAAPFGVCYYASPEVANGHLTQSYIGLRKGF